MNKSDFDFYLPERLIAQTPLEKRDSSRLLHLDKRTGEIEHKHFHDITQYLKKGDCLVLNDSRVLPARLIGSRRSAGAVELVLLRDLGEGRWECLSRPGRKTKPGTELFFGDGELTATVESVVEGGNRVVKFHYEGVFLEKLERLGKMPLPPYIKEELQDSERYQTVYSRELGSAAAPTAGLHFTKELLREIEDMGVKICYVTLHVGLGTFRPVKAEKIEEHEMHSEFCIVSEETARIVNETKRAGGRVIAVGTTSCRTLESFAKENGEWTVSHRPTPGYSNDDAGYEAWLRSGGYENDEIYITEVMAQNRGTLADSDGDLSDWIEIANLGETSVDLAGWYLSDDPDVPDEWKIPPLTLAPGEYAVIFASGKNRTEGELHTSFSLTDGDTVILSAGNGAEIRSVKIEAVPEQKEGGVSFGSKHSSSVPDCSPARTVSMNVTGSSVPALEKLWARL